MTSPAPALPPTVADYAAADALVHREVLNELIELGMGLARRIAAEPVIDHPAAACAMSASFEQVSRTVRRTVRLAQWLARAPAVRPAEPEPGRAGHDRAEARVRMRRTLEDHLAWAEQFGRGGEARHAEMLERLEGLDVVEALDHGRPVAEIIQEIRADLGLLGVQQHRRRTPADVADLRAWAGKPPEFRPQTAEGHADRDLRLTSKGTLEERPPARHIWVGPDTG